MSLNGNCVQQIAEMEIFESSSSLTGGDEGSQPASAPSPESWWGGVWRTQPPRGWEGGTLALVWKISLSLSLTHTPLHTHTHTPQRALCQSYTWPPPSAPTPWGRRRMEPHLLPRFPSPAHTLVLGDGMRWETGMDRTQSSSCV